MAWNLDTFTVFTCFYRQITVWVEVTAKITPFTSSDSSEPARLENGWLLFRSTPSMVAAWVIFLFASMGVGHMLGWSLETVPEGSLSDSDALQRSNLITPELREVFSLWGVLAEILSAKVWFVWDHLADWAMIRGDWAILARNKGVE